MLLPFVVLIVIVGSFGGFIVVRDLSSRAQAALDKDLLEASLRARAALTDRELYLLESAAFASGLEGMAEQIAADDRSGAARLLGSVLALKTDLTLLAVGRIDRVFVGFARNAPSADPRPIQPVDIGRAEFVRRAAQGSGSKSAGYLTEGNRQFLAVAAAICSARDGCAPVGVAVAAVDLDVLAAEVARGLGNDRSGGGLFIADDRGNVLASRGLNPPSSVPRPRVGELTRRSSRVRGPEVAWLYAPLLIQGRQQGTVAVGLPTAPAFAGARRTGIGLAAVLLAAMTGAVAIGALLSRSILRQVRPLVETSRDLGAGDLSARAPVLRDDELGELAQRMNRMAEELQAANETLELRVEQRTAEIDRLLRERTRLFASISHEFRTPIAVILSQVRMLLDPDFRERRRRLLESARTIAESGEQLLALVNDVLAVAQAEEGHLEINLRELPVATIVDEVRTTARGLSSGRDLQLLIDVPPGLPNVIADPVRLREVILSLLDNAVKYTPAGGSVTLAATSGKDWVDITVSDTGIGIPGNVGDLVFEPFYRVPDARTQRGEPASGLGLALAKRLVEGQGGRITYESIPGRGTNFAVRIPVASHQPPPGRRRPGPQSDRRYMRTATTRR
jgi:signal transduction histidine kinase